MNPYEDIIRDLLEECNDDYVGLAKVISDVRVSLAFSEVMEPTLYVIGILLDRGVIAGQVEDNAFRIWRMPKDEILARITKEWIELGHDPTMGEIVWLTAEEGLQKKSRIKVI